MSELSEWSNTIRRIGEENEQKMLAYLAKAEEDMPNEVAKLPTHSNTDLLHLFVQFQGGRSDPRETVMRQKFAEHIKEEILRRMEPK